MKTKKNINLRLQQTLDRQIIRQQNTRMEEARQLFYNRKLVPANPQRKTPQDADIINARCKKDHLSHSTFSQKKNISSYTSNFSPPKLHPHYHSTTFDRQLEIFRKNESNSSLRLPTITDNTQYQNLYRGSPQPRVVKSKEKESWFIKSEWPQKLSSVYQKDYLKKSSNNYNSLNKLRVNYNSLKVFDLRSAPKTVSEYREEFKTYHVKPEGKMVGRDQLGKQNQFLKKEGVGHKKCGTELNVGRWKGELAGGRPVKRLKLQRKA